MRDPSDKRDLTRSRAVAARDEAVITPSMKYRLYPFVVAKSDGVRMWDKDGNEYLDWMATGGTAAAGYGHPKVRQAAMDAINNEYSGPLVCYIHEPAVELAERLIDIFPGSSPRRPGSEFRGPTPWTCWPRWRPSRREDRASCPTSERSTA